MLRRQVATCRRLVLAVLLALTALAASPDTARAHTDFAGSRPADGDEVTGPVDRVTVSFTNPATPSGDGLVLLDDGGAEVPSSLQVDGTDFILVPDRPLESGAYGVRWEVRAGDAHPIDGSFSFTVWVPPTSSAPSSSPSAETTPGPDQKPPTALEDALEETSTPWVTPVRGLSRLFVTAGAMLAVGGLAALVTTIRGRPEELRAVLSWIRVAGGLVFLGGALRLGVLLATVSGGPPQAWGSSLGLASLLRVVGGFAVVLGVWAGLGSGGAGVALTALVIEDPSDLWSSSWGLILLAKTAVVAVGALLGAAVHLRLRPALQRGPSDPGLASRVRRSLSAEALAFAAVIALTSSLVSAST